MSICDTCRNDYDKCFEVIFNGKQYTFDSLECAIHILAPKCEHCDMKIIGHGVEVDDQYFCCPHCATHAKETELKNHSKARNVLSSREYGAH